MSIKTLLNDNRKISKIATIAIFLALTRCIAEPFRLQYYSTTSLTFYHIKPYLIGSLVSAFGLLVMTILFYFGKHKIIIAICVLTIVALLIIKMIYLS